MSLGCAGCGGERRRGDADKKRIHACVTFIAVFKKVGGGSHRVTRGNLPSSKF